MRPEFLGILALLAVCACSGPYSQPAVSASEPARPLRIDARVLRLETIPEVISAAGELFAEDVATISSKAVGRVAKMHVDIGSRVAAGQVIVEIERIEYEVRAQAAEALVEQARARLGLRPGEGDDVDPATRATVREAAATLEEARLNFDRIAKLFQQGILSRTDFDRGQAALRLAEARQQGAVEEIHFVRAQLLERRAQLRIARQQLEETAIRAPFAGAVTRRLAVVGEYMTLGSPVLAIARVHPLRIRLEVPERQSAKVRIGHTIQVRLQGDRTRSGRVVRLSPSLDAQNRSLLVEGEIPNEDFALRPGAFAEGSITVDPRAQGLAVPAGAVVSFAGVDRVYAVERGALAERVVRLGRRMPDGSVEVVDGLRPGETIVAQAGGRMSNGQPVVVQ